MIRDLCAIREKLDKKIDLGFPHGCEGIHAGWIYTLLSPEIAKAKGCKDTTSCILLLAGISKSQEFFIYNLDNSLTWEANFPETQPIFLSKITTLPDWNIPKSLSFFSSKTANESLNQFILALYANHKKIMENSTLTSDMLHTV